MFSKKLVILMFSVLFLCSFERMLLSKSEFFQNHLPILNKNVNPSIVKKFLFELDSDDLYYVLVKDDQGNEIPKFKIFHLLLEKVKDSKDKKIIQLLAPLLNSENVSMHDKCRINKIALEELSAPFSFTVKTTKGIFKLGKLNQVYTVKKGDSLSLLGFKYYHQVGVGSVQLIKQSNGLLLNFIIVGQKINIYSLENIELE